MFDVGNKVRVKTVKSVDERYHGLEFIVTSNNCDPIWPIQGSFISPLTGGEVIGLFSFEELELV